MRAVHRPNHHDDPVSRREFLGRLSIALSALAAAVVGIPIVAYLLSPLIHPETNVWIPLGDAAKFRVGETVQVSFRDPSPLPWAGLTAETAVWVRRNSAALADFTVFAVNCTHLGCPVNWLPDARIFLCPCHGGVFYADGTVAAGPPPRPLFEYQSRVRDGRLEILTRPLPIG
ncbi:MAG: Rieske 2Fe-2S domain-containing protein [Chloroflexi bacterium]|nr:Rieske 2Fe-2S domain-containing protein [Chloroflexota bacterium]